MKILITGSAGFVGRHFKRKLMNLGHDVIGIDIANGIDARD
jgi:nucleoside-diphosphate-sugar epimerase